MHVAPVPPIAASIRIALPLAAVETGLADAEDGAFAALIPQGEASEVDEALAGSVGLAGPVGLAPPAMPEAMPPAAMGLVASTPAALQAVFPVPEAGITVPAGPAGEPVADPAPGRPGEPVELDAPAPGAMRADPAGLPHLTEAAVPDLPPAEREAPVLTPAASAPSGSGLGAGQGARAPTARVDALGAIPLVAVPAKPDPAPDTLGTAPPPLPIASAEPKSPVPVGGTAPSLSLAAEDWTVVAKPLPVVDGEDRLPLPGGQAATPPDTARALVLPSAAERLWLGTNAAPPPPAPLPDPAARPFGQEDTPRAPTVAEAALVLAGPGKVTLRAVDPASPVPDRGKPSVKAEGRPVPVLAAEAVLRPVSPVLGLPASDTIAPLAEAVVLPDSPDARLVPGQAPPSLAPGGAGPVLSAHSLPRLAEAMVAVVATRGDGSTEIALAPEELGKVRLQVQTDAQTPDRLVVLLSFERPETMDLFRRHAADLSETLREAGYGDARLEFGQSGPDARAGSGQDKAPALVDTAAPPPPHLHTEAAASPTGYRTTGSLDIRL